MADKDEIDSMTPEDDLSKSTNDLHKIWEKSMHDFEPEDMISFKVDHNSVQVFLEDINHTKPTEVKGVFYIDGASDSKPLSGVIVQDPFKNVVYKRSYET